MLKNKVGKPIPLSVVPKHKAVLFSSVFSISMSSLEERDSPELEEEEEDSPILSEDEEKASSLDELVLELALMTALQEERTRLSKLRASSSFFIVFLWLRACLLLRKA